MDRYAGPMASGPDAVLRNEDLPALFWDELPDDPNNPDVAAIKAIMDESTPEERAESFKDQGNDALKVGMQQKKKFYLRQAIEQYTEGLNLMCGDVNLNAILYANRAHVNLLLGNYRNALNDSKAAIRNNPQFVKAYWRGAKGASGLRHWDECIRLCEAGQALEPENTELQRLRQRAEADKVADEKRQEEQRRREIEKRAPAARLASALLHAGWRTGRPQFSVGDRKPTIDEHGAVHWPSIFFYPEASMQQDVIEDFSVDDSFGDHLDAMFGPDAPGLEWDSEGAYHRDNLEVYYLSYASKPLSLPELTEALYGGWPETKDEGPSRYGPEAASWKRVNEKWTLGDVLAKKDHIVPGIPVFFILSSKTSYKQRFLSGDIALL